MPFVNHQSIWVTGTRVYFQRDPLVLTPGGTPVEQPIVDLGELTNAAPTLNPTDVTLFSGDGGVSVPIAVTRVKTEESYDLTSNNLNQDNLALMFSALPPQDFVQASTPITASHYCDPGCLLKLHDAAGLPVYGVTSVTSVGSLTAGTDYELILPERGFIRFIEGGAFAAPGALSITFVPRAISSTDGKRRLIHPNTGGCVAVGTALIIWGRCGNNEQTVREVRVAISSSGGAFPDGNYADVKFKITVLSDPTIPAAPAGRLLYWLGGMPRRS